MAASDLVNDDQPSGCMEGVVDIASGDPNAAVFVTLTANGGSVGPCPWSPKPATDDDDGLVAVGDNCWVSFSDGETPVVVMWWRAANFDELSN